MNLDRVIAVRNTKTIYRDGNRCVKVFGEQHPKSEILQEALNIARVEEVGISAPRLMEVSAIDGKWALTYAYIQGHTLAELMEKNPQKKDDYLERFVSAHRAIHAHTCFSLNPLREKLGERIERNDLKEETRRKLIARLEGMPAQNQVCHGDYNPSNVILSDDETVHVIDWAEVTRGSADADAATTYLLFLLRGDARAAEAYLRLFCQTGNASEELVRAWLPIVAAAYPARRSEKDVFSRWIDLVHHE